MLNATPSEPRRIVVLVGLPGSGKSEWLRRNGLSALSSDEIRRLLRDNPADQTIHRIVFALLRRLLRLRLELGMTTSYIDATNTTPWERRAYVRIGQLYGCETEAVYFDTPIEVCLERNRRRERVVPEDAVRQMAAKLVTPSLEEGFRRVTVVSNTAGPSTSPTRAE